MCNEKTSQEINRYNKKNIINLLKVLGKIVLGVGKSSLLLRFADGIFTESLLATLGVNFKIRGMTWNERTKDLML